MDKVFITMQSWKNEMDWVEDIVFFYPEKLIEDNLRGTIRRIHKKSTPVSKTAGNEVTNSEASEETSEKARGGNRDDQRE